MAGESRARFAGKQLALWIGVPFAVAVIVIIAASLFAQ